MVNTEVDYRDEEDSILVDPDEEPAQDDGRGEARSIARARRQARP